MVLIIYAHPYPQHSHANKRMLEQTRTLENVEIRSSINSILILISMSPPNRRRSLDADLIVWQHPMQWYSTLRC